MEIDIERMGATDRWRVAVRARGQRSEHTVTVADELARDLGFGPEEVETLVRVSFEFLLEREPPQSILATFSIDQIGHYFSDYPAAVRRSRR
ncbi:MAG: hypothetical protein ACRDWE_10495 [Acidimicrobiales bacterium]